LRMQNARPAFGGQAQTSVGKNFVFSYLFPTFFLPFTVKSCKTLD